MSYTTLTARRIFHGVTLAAGLVLAASLAIAQPFPTPPEPQAPRAPHVDAPFDTTLPNGLRVIVASRPDTPLATVQLVLRAGSEFDRPGREGLADITAALLTKGSQAGPFVRHAHDAAQIAQNAEALGGSLDASAGWHATTIGMTITSPKLDDAVGLIANTALRPAFRRDEIELERKQRLDGLRVAYAQPGGAASAVAAHAVFGDGAYGHRSIGTPDSVTRISRADMIALHRSIARPDNAVLVFAGGIAPERALDLARRHLGGWRAAPSAKPVPREPMGTPSDAKALVVDLAQAGQAAVVVAMPGVARASSDYTVGTVANAVLGGGYSSRLNQEIRIKRGLSYGAQSSFDARRSGGVIALAAQTKNESAAEVVRLMRGTLDELAATPVSSDELDVRKAALIGTESRALDTTQGLATRVAQLAINDVPLDELGRSVERVERITPEQVRSFAAKYWKSPALRVIVAGDAQVFERDVQKQVSTVERTGGLHVRQ